MDGERLIVEPTSKIRILKFSEEGRGKRGPSANDKCYNCNKYGHW